MQKKHKKHRKNSGTYLWFFKLVNWTKSQQKKNVWGKIKTELNATGKYLQLYWKIVNSN